MDKSKILAAVICCDYKKESLPTCLDAIKKAGFDVLVNYEGSNCPATIANYFQMWRAVGSGFNERKFDQDQSSRLTRICVARNMVMDFFQQTDYDYLLFVDSDVLIPEDAFEKLFSTHYPMSVLSGLVPGRGVHSHAQYLFGPIERIEANVVSVEYATCGFLTIPRDLVFRTRFRWGLPTKGGVICSEDPLFGQQIREEMGYKWLVFTDCKASHLGDLKNGETSQF